MENEFDVLDGTDEFPYPISIARTDFKNFNEEEIDQFLYKNHRFTSIDILIKELSQLSNSLNQTLLDLVNNDYNDFIKLGKSINGGFDLINLISGDLKGFKLELTNYQNKFNTSYETLDNVLNKRQQLIELKTSAKLNLLLHDQVVEFDNYIEQKDTIDLSTELKKLTGLYLSISNINQFLESRQSNQFQETYLANKISSLKYEFKSYLDQLAKREITNNKKDSSLILEILNVYKMIGLESDLLDLIHK
ncbi:uncharacterized protein J8A68_003204 [[Candida] subhashii]|uniref:Conserved oligomeric Golgi complex subunit 2 n=1 Tax=[Candida] subhashii TaxID=561895 RepID=A0A8J5UWV4_9ASCO|nr:uncharacterized protein J8A68_003204 [[Candida] subhashii]KAG7663290.1 hypothetical protein J8A68_003204 [[Candida] subhashii]